MRVGIALTGTALAAAGGAGLCLGLVGGDLAARPLLDPAVSRYADGTAWFWPVAAAAAVAVAACGLLWLAAHGRAMMRRRRAALDGPTRMRARAAERDLLRDALRLPGVRDARLRLTGTAVRPRLLLNLTCTGDAVLGEVYGELGAGAAERYRAATGMPDLVVVIRFRMVFGEPAPV